MLSALGASLHIHFSHEQGQSQDGKGQLFLCD